MSSSVELFYIYRIKSGDYQEREAIYCLSKKIENIKEHGEFRNIDL